MIKLEEVRSHKSNTEQMEKEKAIIEASKSAAENQKKLGLGNPKESMNMLVETNSASSLLEHFKEVKKPSEFHFTKFTKSYAWGENADTVSGIVTDFPKIAQVELDNSVSKLTMTIEGVYKEAAIPLIPKSVQELAARAKNLVPSMKFHLIFCPQWERKPNPDPVLVGEAAGRFFEIARWDGDSALIEEFLENI